MLNALLLSVAPLIGGPTVTWNAPEMYMEGVAFGVTVEIEMGDKASNVDAWLMNAGAFTLNGKPLTKRSSDELSLAAGTKLSLSFDLGPDLAAAKGFSDKGFKLAFDSKFSKADAVKVAVAIAAPKGVDYMEIPLEDLSKYEVIMNTNQGMMHMEFWPDAAPNHVRNYLDLCDTGFYDNVIFHRVIPGFMIQGGDPSGTGSGPGRRNVDAEFSTDAKWHHKRGVLSMARMGHDVNSGSSQFFVMHADYPSLNGQYSAFGKLISGFETVDKIATTPNSGSRPVTKQVILSTTVILATK
jgi:cyclophilin family peptidyl-prolyl cis-trans isomerase